MNGNKIIEKAKVFIDKLMSGGEKKNTVQKNHIADTDSQQKSFGSDILDFNCSSDSKTNEAMWEGLSEERVQKVLYNDFNLKFSFQRYSILKDPTDKNSAVINLFGDNYIFYEILEKESVNILKPVKIQKISGEYTIYAKKDIYNRMVLVINTDLPIFDSCDSMYDRWHTLYLISDSKKICGIYCTGGWCGVESLAVFEDMTGADAGIMKYLKKLSFPVSNGKIRKLYNWKW